MKYILFFFITTAPAFSIAGLSDCGEYEVRGVVRAKLKNYEIVVNEKTMSEINIAFHLRQQLKLLPYINRPVTIALILDKKFDGTKGISEKIISVKKRIPDPLKSGDTGLVLIKKLECTLK